MSQVKDSACTLEQSSPFGQHSTVVSSAKDMQELPLGQQKSSGSPPPHWSKLVGHVGGSARRRCRNDRKPGLLWLSRSSLMFEEPCPISVATAGRDNKIQMEMLSPRKESIECIETTSSG